MTQKTAPKPGVSPRAIISQRGSAPTATAAPAASRQLMTLAAATDALNGAIQDAEKALASLDLGVSARVPLEPITDEDGDLVALTFLAFAKRGDHWRVLWQSQEPDSDVEEKPLVSAPRWARVNAVTHLEELHDAIVASAKREIEAVQRATAIAGHFAATVRARSAENDVGDDIPF